MTKKASKTDKAQKRVLRVGPKPEDPVLREARERLDLQIESAPIADLRASEGNARKHSKKQITQIAASIEQFGFIGPIIIDESNRILAGHARVLAAKSLGMKTVPTVRVEHLSEEQKRACVIALNRLAELAEWDQEILAVELKYLVDMNFDVGVAGFEIPEVDLIIGAAGAAAVEDDAPVPAIDRSCPSVTRLGDVWRLGSHRLLCGDAREEASYRALLSGRVAYLAFTDPPYNVRIAGNVSGRGRTQHEEFEMASGEMTEAEFDEFLGNTLGLMARYSRSGAVHFVCMDWRHLLSLLRVAKSVYSSQLNLCVWNKTNGGLGSLYRSKHELIGVFKAGDAAHLNNVQLGRFGRNRSNVWDYAGGTALHGDRQRELEMHPTVKPVRMVADAILDCSKQNSVVLDPFVGSGTTILAAEQTHRRCYAMEIDPYFVDVAVRRWQDATDNKAVMEASSETFDFLAETRRNEDVGPEGRA